MGYCVKILFSYLLYLYSKICRKSGRITKEDFKNKNLKIGIICSAGIGDALMVTPLISYLKKINGDLIIDVISCKKLKEIFVGNDFIRNLLIFNKKKISGLISVFNLLKKNNYDVIFGAQPSNTLIDAFLSCASKVRIKIDKINKSYLEYRINKLYTYIIPDSFEKHRIEINLDMLRFFGFELEPFKSNLYFKTENLSAEKIISEYTDNKNFIGDYICIHPGSGGDYKRWNINNFCKLADILTEKYKIVLIGGEDEKELSDFFKGKNNIYDLIGRISLDEVFNILKSSKVFICNDSGMMHLACAANAKIIALFGKTNPAHIGPYNRDAVVIKKENMEDIKIDEVTKEIERIIVT